MDTGSAGSGVNWPAWKIPNRAGAGLRACAGDERGANQQSNAEREKKIRGA